MAARCSDPLPPPDCHEDIAAEVRPCPSSGLLQSLIQFDWHIDTRADGGYVVAEGSAVHGHIYVALDLTTPVELPGWIANLVATPPPMQPRAPSPDPRRGPPSLRPRRARRGDTAVHDGPVGQRNAALIRAAWNLGRHIASGLVERVTVEDALQAVGEAVGGRTPPDVAATIRSAIDARLRKGHAS